MRLILVRDTTSYLTLGKIYLPGRTDPICETLEPGPPGVGEFERIPAGTYMLVYWLSPTKGPAYGLGGVPGRTGIMIHAGNFLKDTEGCILPGMERHDDCLWHSRVAFTYLRATIAAFRRGSERIDLEVRD